MRTLSVGQQERLKAIFGPWVSFDEEERRIYSHDIGPIPKIIRPVIGHATAEAVVQPDNEDQLIELLAWANDCKVPLVPRAKASSGYGGVTPIKGGVSVSMSRFRSIVEIDAATETVRVQPAVVWEDLERALAREGLGLRTYPSSAPSSTVGGWLAQGGVGYGAYEFDAFRHNVLAARVVLPSGEVRTFEAGDLDLISEAEGITGFITEVTLRVRKREQEGARLVRFPDAEALTSALRDVVDEQAPLWSVSFVNPNMVMLKNRVPPRMKHGVPVAEERPELPEGGYLVMFVAPESRWPVLTPILQAAADRHGGEYLSDELARHEWEQRFDLMHIKRLGPTLLPAEAIVPLSHLDRFLEDIDKRIRQPLTLEGMVQVDRHGGTGAQVTLIGFIPHDERTWRFGVAYALALTLVQTARKYGGRSYSTGMYFTSQAADVLGRDRVQRLRDFKEQVDPVGIMNPGKVCDGGLIGHLIGVALPFEPLMRWPANLFRSAVGERLEGQGRRGIPDDIAWYAYACAQCGYCVDTCAQYYGRGWESESPRGRWYFLRDYMEGRAEMSPTWVAKFLACTTCDLCTVRCPLELPIEPSWFKMRQRLVQDEERMTFPPFEMMRAAARKELNIWGAYNRDRDKWIPTDLKDQIPERADVAYFAGCTASFVEKDIAEGTARLLRAAGIDFTYLGNDEACCGLPILCSGHWDTFEEILRHNVETMRSRGVKTVVTSCPACWLSWHTYYPQWAEKLGIEFPFEIKHYSELLAEKLDRGELKFPHPVSEKVVTWHDSCHIGRAGGIYEPPRKILKALPGVEVREMDFNREAAHCCGSVLSLLDSPDGAALRIGGKRLSEAEATGAQALVALCPCCEVQFRVTAQKTSSPMRIVDLAHLAAEGLGVALPDPTAYAMEQWATFEAMIKLLKPEAMADFMVPLLPRMIEVMPAPLAGMMRWTKASSPGNRRALLAMMRPMMPALFPRLLPGMMPKLMPDFMRAMEHRIPMPEDLKEQMPELLPEVMDQLMPKMLPLMLPYLVPKVEAYLNGELDEQLEHAA